MGLAGLPYQSSFPIVKMPEIIAESAKVSGSSVSVQGLREWSFKAFCILDALNVMSRSCRSIRSIVHVHEPY